MSKEVLNGDPNLALFSGKIGTDLYEKLLQNKLEIGNNNISFFEDYSGCERFGEILF